MAYDEDLAGRIRVVLTGRCAFAERKMFGGLAFMIEGPDGTFRFLRGIARNNKKEWFEAHRADYESTSSLRRPLSLPSAHGCRRSPRPSASSRR